MKQLNRKSEALLQKLHRLGRYRRIPKVLRKEGDFALSPGILRLKKGLLCGEEEEAAATLEIVIIIAVLLAIALLFNKELRAFAKTLFDKIFNEENVLSHMGEIGS